MVVSEAELARMGRQSKAKDVRYVHGMALLATGKRKSAREKLEQSVSDVTDEYPNPLAYLAHSRLAELDLIEDRLREAAWRLLDRTVP